MRKAKGDKGAPAQRRAALPPGFRSISTGSFPPNFDFDKNETLQGIVQQKRTTPQKRGKKTVDVSILYVAQEPDGEIFAVWESAALEGLMKEAKPGDRVFIRFDGIKKLGKKKTLKQFTAGILEGKKRGK